MSDNAETREALREQIADTLAHWPIGSGYYSTSVGNDEAREMADAVLAALPPVAGPEVRPDETLRARVEALCDEAEHDTAIVFGVSIPRLRAALASPASTDQEADHA